MTAGRQPPYRSDPCRRPQRCAGDALPATKYRPNFPGRFGSIEDARAHCQPFFRWYNFEHRHAGIALLTPADVHYGRATGVIAARAHILMNAYATNPERFVRKPPAPRQLPVASWINKPDEKEDAAQ